MTDAQLQAGQELIEKIRDDYPGIHRSADMRNGPDACPGGTSRFFLGESGDEGDVEGEAGPSAWALDAWGVGEGEGHHRRHAPARHGNERGNHHNVMEGFEMNKNMVEGRAPAR